MENDQSPSWWKRNWKWAVPTGGCLFIIICVVSCVGYSVYKVADKLSEDTSVFAFIEVVSTVQKNEELAEVLGKPIRIEDEDYDPELVDNHMELDIELDGSKHSGILKVSADKTDDGWEYSKFEVTVNDTGQVIDLLETVNN